MKKKTWAKLEAMRPYCCCLEIMSDYDFVWGVRFVLASGIPPWRDMEEAPHEWSEDSFNSDTIEEAVDKAYRRFLALHED